MGATGASSSSLLLALGALCRVAHAVPWVVTNYIIETTSTYTQSTDTFDGYVYSGATYTDVYTITPTVSPVPAVATSTSVYTYEDITYVNIVVPPSAGMVVDTFDYGDDYYSSDEIEYYVPITYTAEPRCTDPWTYVSDVSVVPPEGITPSPVSTTWSTDPYYAYYTSTITTYYLDPSQIPRSSLASLRSYNEPTFSAACDLDYYYTGDLTQGRFIGPTPTGTSSGGDGGFNNPSDVPARFNTSDCNPFEFVFAGTLVGGGYDCIDGEHYTYGISLVGFIFIWICTWFGLFFFAGLLQNWLSFRALSLGRRARRGVPLLWGLMIPILSLLLLIGSWAGYKGKEEGEKRRLRERWDGLGPAERLKQWVKWGFRHKYPPFLGVEPVRRNATAVVPVAGAAMPGSGSGGWQGLPPTPPVRPDGTRQYQVWDPNTRQWMVWVPNNTAQHQNRQSAQTRQSTQYMQSAQPRQSTQMRQSTQYMQSAQPRQSTRGPPPSHPPPSHPPPSHPPPTHPPPPPPQVDTRMSSALPSQDVPVQERGRSVANPSESEAIGVAIGGPSHHRLSSISPVSPIEPPELPPRNQQEEGKEDNGEGSSGSGKSVEKSVVEEKSEEKTEETVVMKEGVDEKKEGADEKTEVEEKKTEREEEKTEETSTTKYSFLRRW